MMAEHFKVVVTPTDGGYNSLTVEEAMRHVLEAFQLLSYGVESGKEVTWRLIEAKTNSPPFSVLAEATPTTPGTEIDAIAKDEKRAFAQAIIELKQGLIPAAWNDDYESLRIANDFIGRISRGIITTIDEVETNHLPNVILPSDVVNVKVTLSAQEGTVAKTKSQIGSIEGSLEQITTYYLKPCIMVKERKTGVSVRCLIDENTAGRFSDKTKLSDVWRHRRVVVRGEIRYKKSGEVREVLATDVEIKENRGIPTEAIYDPNFTNGLSISDYLEKLREGQLGGH